MNNRLLQDEAQTYDGKRLCRWFASRVNARQEATLVGEMIRMERMSNEEIANIFSKLTVDLPGGLATHNEHIDPLIVGKETLRQYAMKRARLDRLSASRAEYMKLDNDTVTKFSEIFAGYD